MTRLDDNIRKRKLSILKGVELLLRYYPISDGDLQKRVKEMKVEIETSSTHFRSVKEAERHFYKTFLDPLVLEIAKKAGKKELSYGKAHQMLMEAESFHLLFEERRWGGEKVLKTETPFQTESGKALRVTQQERPFYHLTDDQKAEYKAIFSSAKQPKWFMALPEWQKEYLKDKLRDVDDVEKVLRSIPSHLMTIPGLVHYGESSLTVGGPDGREEDSLRVFRHAIAVPYDIEDRDERLRLARQNVKQLFKGKGSPFDEMAKQYIASLPADFDPNVTTIEVPVLIQTLLSPTRLEVLKHIGSPQKMRSRGAEEKRVIDDLEEVMGNLVNLDLKKIKVGEITYDVKPVLIHSNYPVNWAKGWLNQESRAKNAEAAKQLLLVVKDFLYLKAGDNEISKILNSLNSGGTVFTLDSAELEQKIDGITEYCNPTKPDDRRLKILLYALKDYVKLYRLQNDPIHRKRDDFLFDGLFLAALEQIITASVNGVAAGGCKSAKDRKGILMLFMNSMITYYSIYGRFPKPGDSPEERKAFVNIFARLFKTFHQLQWAGSQAPGAEGILNINPRVKILPLPEVFKILPQDMQVAIFPPDDSEVLRENDFLARLAKAKTPYRHKVSDELGSREVFVYPDLEITSEGKSHRITQPTEVLKKMKEIKAVYIPKGWDANHPDDTLAVQGDLSAQVKNAPAIALEFYLNHPEGPYFLSGAKGMLEALQWIFIVAFHVSRDKIHLVPSYEGEELKPITVEGAHGHVRVPAYFRSIVRDAREMIEKDDRVKQRSLKEYESRVSV